jgi:acetyl-CoA carboxylase carboxyl transferase subunit alpha
MPAPTRHYLDFERPIADLEAKIDELSKLSASAGASDFESEISVLRARVLSMRREAYAKLDPWQKTQVARHPERPHFRDYVAGLITDFVELRGDRTFGDDQAIVGGLGRFRGQSVVVMGHEKGRDTASRLKHNFGMARPEGYRKAVRLMDLAEQFNLPVLTFVDTAGAYPGVGAEERGQSEAIARNLLEMADLKTPIVCTVIGEGGSGGALAIGVGDRVNMLQYSTYSVISPEGCASILWKSQDKARDAAEALGMTAPRLHELGLVDKVIREPLGGAHRNPRSMAIRLKAVLLNQLDELETIPAADLLELRYKRLRGYGAYQG